MSDYDNAVEIREALLELGHRLGSEKERRRYALLQAAITILPVISSDRRFDGFQMKAAIELAEQTLEAIEKREKAEGGS